MKDSFLKSWIFIFFTLWFFVVGVKEYIIIPTSWFYIRSLGGTKRFLGAVLAMPSIISVLFSPLFGVLSDKFRCPKTVLIACLVVGLCGGLIYTIPVSKYYPLFGRLLSGFSYASEVIIIGEVARMTEENERAKAFIIMEGIFSLGCGFGPVMAAIFTFEVDIFGWRINAGNSGVFVLVFVLAVFVILALFLPKNFGNETLPDNDDNKSLIQAHNDTDDDGRSEKRDSFKYSEYSRILFLFYLIFLTWFLSTVVNFYTPLLATELFHLDQLHVKLLFTIATLCLLMLYLALFIANAKHFKVRNLLLFVMSLQIIPIFILFIFGLYWKSVPAEFSYLLIIYISIGISYSVHPLACSLLSKVTNPNESSFYQGFSVTILNSAIIAGRLISGFIFAQTSVMIFSIVLGFLWFLGLIWFAFLYRQL